jgi:transcription elongation factor Elf1
MEKLQKSLKNYYKEHPEAKVQKEYKCPHCGKVASGNGMLRRHFDNCKQKG